MELLRFQDVHKDYGHKPVLAGTSFSINAGDKVGLIGANGAGKTTALKLILGHESPTSGVITRMTGLRVGYVPQFAEIAPGSTVLDAVLSDVRAREAELRSIESDLSSAAPANLDTVMAAYDDARSAFDAAGGDIAEQRAVSLLDSLGLPGREDAPAERLSGGEKNVLSLARALLAEPDLLALDEPGNHLDFAGLAWLEGFLASFRGAVLIVSHNRYLLDRVATSILHLHDGAVDTYSGNYSAYRAESLRGKLAQRADYMANQKRLAQLEELVRRFRQIASSRPDPAWGKRLRARVSQLEREKAQAIEKPSAEASPLRLSLTRDTSKAAVALQVRGYTKAFGAHSLFEDASLDLEVGQRVALVGPNGCGKTTFLRDVLAEGAWDAATIRIGPSLRVGYCAQEQDILDDARTVLGQVLLEDSMTRERAITVLARFMFNVRDLDTKISDLSGGERNRLQLAILTIRQPDFLILDEPTNHLDIPACEAIEDALADFAGTVLLVSHDRYLLDKVADHVVEVRDRRFETFAGNFSEYWAATRPIGPTRARVTTRAAHRRGAERQRDAAASNDGLAAAIEEAEHERDRLERAVADAYTAGNQREGERATKLLERQRKRIDELYGRWLAGDEGQ